MRAHTPTPSMFAGVNLVVGLKSLKKSGTLAILLPPVSNLLSRSCHNFQCFLICVLQYRADILKLAPAVELRGKEKAFLLSYLILLPSGYHTSNTPVFSAGIFKALSTWWTIAKDFIYRAFNYSEYVTLS